MTRKPRYTSVLYAVGDSAYFHCIPDGSRGPGPAEIQRQAWESWAKGHPLATTPMVAPDGSRIRSIAEMMADAREREDALA